MKILKIIGILVLSLLLLVVIGSFFITKRSVVERKITINAAPKDYFDLINDLQKWPMWMPWYKMDTAMQITYGPTTKGTAAYYTWISKNKNVGTGKISIASSMPYDEVKISLEFGQNGISNGWFKFAPIEKSSELTWGIEITQAEMPIIGKWIGLMMDKMVGKDFENGLASIKQLAEAGPTKVAGTVASISQTQVDACEMMQSSKVGMNDSVANILGNLYGLIGNCIKEKGLNMSYPLMAMYPDYEPGKTNFTITACVKVDKKVTPCSTDIKCVSMAACQAIVANYYGPYEGIDLAYNQLFDYAKKNSLAIDSLTSWEEYVSDPMTEKDPSKILTKVYIKLK